MVCLWKNKTTLRWVTEKTSPKSTTRSKLPMEQMDDWGEIVLVIITNGDEFWTLFDELEDDESGFIGNRSVLVDAYKDGNLYGLKVTETDSMYHRGAQQDKIFC